MFLSKLKFAVLAYACACAGLEAFAQKIQSVHGNSFQFATEHQFSEELTDNTAMNFYYQVTADSVFIGTDLKGGNEQTLQSISLLSLNIENLLEPHTSDSPKEILYLNYGAAGLAELYFAGKEKLDNFNLSLLSAYEARGIRLREDIDKNRPQNATVYAYIQEGVSFSSSSKPVMNKVLSEASENLDEISYQTYIDWTGSKLQVISVENSNGSVFMDRFAINFEEVTDIYIYVKEDENQIDLHIPLFVETMLVTKKDSYGMFDSQDSRDFTITFSDKTQIDAFIKVLENNLSPALKKNFKKKICYTGACDTTMLTAFGIKYEIK
jgi:hypothetical protein